MLVLNQERKEVRMDRMLCLEPGKEGYKDWQDLVERIFFEPGKEGRVGLEPGKEGCEDGQDQV